MATTSTQTVEVVERPAEQAERPATPRFVSPQPVPEDTRWTIKLSGSIPV